jgi:cellulose synthase/poly-beta-1,6-N-acetylglucosamine synthase-like glycosyltransferase
MIAPQAIFCILIFLINLIFIVWIYRGLKKAISPDTSQNPIDNSFSIIIAAHNEENKIGLCLERLATQNYPKEKYEVILIADRCSDSTVQIANRFQDKFHRLKIVEIAEVPEGIAPKKNALDKGTEVAMYDHFLFLDADVIPTKNHIQVMNQYFNEDVAVVVGIMKLELQSDFLHDFLKYERLLNWSVAAGSIGNGNPIISYGGNWGYTRQAFETVSGFEDIYHSLGGDDDLLLQKFGKAGLTIRFCTNPDGWISTQAPETFRAFLDQRKRHLSASKYYQNKFKVGYFLYHSSNLLLWTFPLLFLPAIFLLLIKFAATASLIRFSRNTFQEKLSLIQTPFWEFAFLVYNTLIPPLGFLGKIKW